MKPEPSIRTRWSGRSATTASAGSSSGVSVSVARAGSFVQNIEARTIGALHLALFDAEIHAGMAQDPVAPITGNHGVIHADDLGRQGGNRHIRHADLFPCWR
jgi:hypothetical protein